jgi:hypothetical protein
MMVKTKKQGAEHRKGSRRSSLPLLLGLGGLALVVLAGIVLSRAGNSEPKAPIEVAGAPSLKVDREKIDFGDVRLGTTVDAAFKLTNVGDQPLRFIETPYIEVAEGC